MYICVKQITLEESFKRPIFIIGPHSERIQLALENQNSKLYKFSVHENIPSQGIVNKILEDSKNVFILHILIIFREYIHFVIVKLLVLMQFLMKIYMLFALFLNL